MILKEINLFTKNFSSYHPEHLFCVPHLLFGAKILSFYLYPITWRCYEQKCSAIFEHVYESYPERQQGVYAAT